MGRATRARASSVRFTMVILLVRSLAWSAATFANGNATFDELRARSAGIFALAIEVFDVDAQVHVAELGDEIDVLLDRGVPAEVEGGLVQGHVEIAVVDLAVGRRAVPVIGKVDGTGQREAVEIALSPVGVG